VGLVGFDVIVVWELGVGWFGVRLGCDRGLVGEWTSDVGCVCFRFGRSSVAPI